MMKPKPDYWKSWTRPIPGVILLMLSLLTLPLHLLAGIWCGLKDGCDSYLTEVGDIWHWWRE